MWLLGSVEHPGNALQHTGSCAAGCGMNPFVGTHFGVLEPLNNVFGKSHFQDWLNMGIGAVQCLEHVAFEMYDPLSGGGQKYESDEPAHATHVFSHHNWQVGWFCGPGWETLLLHPPLLQHAGCFGNIGANGSRTHCGAVLWTVRHRHDWLNSGICALHFSTHVAFSMYDPLLGGGQKYPRAMFEHAKHFFPHPVVPLLPLLPFSHSAFV